MMTAQEVFDKVASHLLTQKAKSLRVDGAGDPACAYRGAGGMSCAVGCLIPDDVYTPKMEGLSSWWLVEIMGVKFPGLAIHAELLGRLQYIHDITAPEGWYIALANLANHCDLSTSVLVEFE